MWRRMRTVRGALAVTTGLLAVAGCGGGDGGGEAGLSGRVEADGSSTVAPFATAAAERFQRESSGVQVTVGVSGTGGGFERFCAGETDVSNASRPIESDEKAACREQGVEFVEFQVANDALTVVVNRQNDWATCLTVAQLRKIWQPGSDVQSWKDVDARFPDERLVLFGPGTDSGTFDYFTEKIVGEEGQSRSDYSASENDTVLVRGVAGERGGLGYFGFSYYDQNTDKLKALEVDGGQGCVAPSVGTAQSGTYEPLSRPLFVYVKRDSLERAPVKAFVEYMLDNAVAVAKDALLVPLAQAQAAQAKRDLDAAVSR
jgi:phosphate transport system substrate-binding protein